MNIKINENDILNITKESKLGTLMQECSAIIIDEAPALNRTVYEVIDKSLKDLRESKHIMGGCPTLLCGDFR